MPEKQLGQLGRQLISHDPRGRKHAPGTGCQEDGGEIEAWGAKRRWNCRFTGHVRNDFALRQVQRRYEFGNVKIQPPCPKQRIEWGPRIVGRVGHNVQHLVRPEGGIDRCKFMQWCSKCCGNGVGISGIRTGVDQAPKRDASTLGLVKWRSTRANAECAERRYVGDWHAVDQTLVSITCQDGVEWDVNEVIADEN
jgi:hypothetical protein